MAIGPITIEEIVKALQLLGGQAQAKHIKDKVTELRGGMPSQYGTSHSYRETIQKKIEDHCPQSGNWNDSNKPYFERVSRGIYRLTTRSDTNQNKNIELLNEEESGPEGGKKARLVSYYERNPTLRNDAIKIHGTTCKACGFNFEAAYGEHGKNYIEVHHIVPISTLQEPSSINPNTDLTVLCSNCHRMVHHKRDEPLSLKQLSYLLVIRLPT